MEFCPLLQNYTFQLILSKVRATEAAADVHGRMRGKVASSPHRVAIS